MVKATHSFFDKNFKLGILGGGQLGRMLIQSAIDFNLNIKILDPDPEAPCKTLANDFVVGKLTDFETVYKFGKNLDVLTIEIENVNIEALKKLRDEGVNVFPQPEAIELIQDKRKQKQFYKENNIPTSDFILIDNVDDLNNYEHFLPAFQKLGKEGYDGRGVQKISNKNDFAKAFSAPSLLEKAIDFEKEIAVIVARNAKGEISLFPPVEMVFHPTKFLVEYLLSPAQVSNDIILQANDIARNIIEKLNMKGILAVEMFVTKDGKVLVNEIAPRPHNSGHQTIKANFTSQYEQHLRAILNLPMGDTRSHTLSAMVNLLGAEGFEGNAVYEGIDEILSMQGVYPHLYGKINTKPYRKMGHITILENDLELLKKKVFEVKEKIRVISDKN